MSPLPPLAFVLLSLAATGASAQARSAADIAAGRAEVLRQRMIAFAVDTYCYKAPATDGTAMVLKIEDLAASAIVPGAGAASIFDLVKVGSFTYRGEGIRVTSDDPRFPDMRVDPENSSLRLPGGDGLGTANLVHSKGGGQCRLALTPYRPPSPSLSSMGPLSERAARAGARAVLAGYRAGVSLPYGRDRFITLMHPESGEDRTLIVTFAAGARHDTRIEAETPLALQGFSFGPQIHGGPWLLGLIGRQPDGSVVHFVLEAEPHSP